MKKDFELMSVQHETSEASLRKRHQEALNELSDQLEHNNKQRAKSVFLSVIQSRANHCMNIHIQLVWSQRLFFFFCSHRRTVFMF